MLVLVLENGEQLSVEYRRQTSNRVALIVEDWNGNRVAVLSWNDLTGEIGTVRVEADINGGNYRRKGIATALLRIANTYMPIKHSAYRTGDGEAWAQSTGDKLPKINTD